MKAIVFGVLFALLLISAFNGALSVHSARANASSKGETVQATGTDWWPMFQHDPNHTGTSTSTGPTTNNTRWTYRTGWSVDSSPAIVSGLVYVGSDDDNVYCLNATTGAFVWSYTTGSLVSSSPAVADGFVYVGSEDDNVYCLNATTGAFVWSYKTGSLVDSSPAVVGGFVYVGSDDDNVYCLNATTGALVWSYTTGGEVWSSPAVVYGLVYVGSYWFDNVVYCLNATTGALVWKYKTGNWVYSSPAVVGGFVYVGSEDDNVYCLNATTGAFVWSYKTGSLVDSSPAIVGGFVYIGSFDDNVYCLNATTGALVWKYRTGWSVDSSPAVVSGLVYVGSDDYSFYCLNATTGAFVWRYKTDRIMESSPAVVNGVVYVGSGDDEIYAFGPPLAVYVSPMSVTMDFGGSYLFISTVYGRTSPYSYQWYLDGAPVSGAINPDWTFTPASAGSYTVYVKVTDAARTQVTSNTATAEVVEEWPMFQHDPDHTGTSTSTGPTTNNTLWIYATGGYVYSSAAVFGGLVYVGSGDNIYCLNATNGVFVWSYKTGYAVLSCPAVAGGFVYVGSWDDKVYCLNATTGALVWRYTTGNIVYSSPAVVGGLVYVGSGDGKVYCLNATTGAFVWRYTTGSGVFSSPAVVGNFVYVGSEDGKVYCLNATTGKLAWSYTTGNAVESSPAVADGFVYVGSDDHNVYCLNATSGALIWRYKTGNEVDSSPAVVGGVAYVGSWDGKVYCLNATTGSQVWNYTTASNSVRGNGVSSPPADMGGFVYVGSGDGNVYCLNATSGAFVWSYTTGGVVGSPAVVNGVVYIGSGDDKIYAFGSLPFNVTVSPKSITLDVGQSKIFTTTASGGSGNYSSYQWYVDGQAQSGQTLSTFTYSPGLPGTYSITVTVTDNLGATSLQSSPATVKVNAMPSVTVSPSSQTMDVGQSQTLDSTVTGGTSPYSYQWYLNGTAITGATASTYMFISSSHGHYNFYVIVIDSAGIAATSNTATITVNNAPSVSISPTSLIMDVGQSQTFNSTVSGGTLPYSYQWYLNGVAASDATSSSWTFTSSSAGSYTVYVKVTDAASPAANTIKSNTASIQVNADPSVGVSPSSATLDVGQSQLFKSTTSGGTVPYSYQWYLNASPVSGATDASWTFAPSSSGSYTIRLKITDNVGTQATSNTVTVTVNGLPTVSISPTSATIHVADTISFSSTVLRGTSPYSYQWYLNGAPISGATQPTWVFAPSAGSYTIYLNITDSLGAKAESNVAPVIVIPALTVFTNPLFASIIIGQSASFNSTANGGIAPYYYQWYLNGARVPTATNPTWTFTPTSPGTYNICLNITDSTGTIALSNVVWVAVITHAVGGVSTSVNALSFLASWLGIVSLMATAVLLKGIITKKKRR